MYTSSNISTKALTSKRAASQLCQAAYGFNPSSTSITKGLRASYFLVNQNVAHSGRPFSSSTRTQLEYFPPPKDAPHIRKTDAAWHHPVYSEKQMKDIYIAHRQTTNWSDRVALVAMKILRFGMDTATGYRHDKEVSLGKKDPTTGDKPRKFAMNERKWMIRFIFLESVAGVPGMVGGMLRHLHSLRRMKRDNGWIETLLEEAYNERMHLLTFMKMAEPGWFMKIMILGAQGVFFNGMFLSYLISPRTCHRFVGYLEEEAVLTYTRAIADIEAGKLPEWNDGELQAPDIAVNYWNMPEGNRSMKDLLLYIRADEAKHREVNHTLGNLAQNEDPNPFVSQYLDPSKPHPTKGIENIKPTGWDRSEVL
ncbi:MAG: Alternative oxidase, mitochondrial precursor [Candelaria pacifica]|nr:MAG: Alternative oxidase, mitochondrial precursor [Candelaria pacifica]